MLKYSKAKTILRLKNQGKSIREISRNKHHSRNSIRIVLRNSESQTPLSSSVDYKVYLENRFENAKLSASKLYEEMIYSGITATRSEIHEYLQILHKKDASKYGFGAPGDDMAGLQLCKDDIALLLWTHMLLLDNCPVDTLKATYNGLIAAEDLNKLQN